MKYPQRNLLLGFVFLPITLFFILGVTPALSAPFNPALQQPNKLETRYIVKFRDTAGLSSLQSANQQLSRQTNLLAARGAKVRKRLTGHNAISVVMDPGEIAQLRSNAMVEYVEIDQPRHFLAQATPWGIAIVQSVSVNDSNAGNTKVCIIDSGYDINNPDLAGNNHNGTNVSGTGNWFVPGGSHGTHVAGTIAAINNSEGVVGILPSGNIGIHVVKVFNEDGWGYASDLIDAIQVCVNANADVVNMSLGGDASSTTERNALQAFTNQGLLLIAAAGNNGNTAYSYPASYSSVISVAAVDENLDHAEFSQANSQVEFSGPGEAVLSTVSIGDGVQSSVSIGSDQFGDDRVVPHNRYIVVGNSYVNQYITGQVSGELAACSVSGSGRYSCGDMNGRVCLVERFDNQDGSYYPEINAVMACANAGAVGAIVYSNTSLPGLQNPFLVDDNGDVGFPSVSVNRDTGLQLLNSVGRVASLRTVGGTDYAYYNGTSMATPHVVGVAALVWSHFPECSNSQIRNALTATALDIDVSGRDNRTGYGLVQAASAVQYLTENGCGGTGGEPGGGTELENGVAVSGLSGSEDEVLQFSITVPAGSRDLSISTSGGSGDADLYVRFGAEPSLSVYDCRPYQNGNNETCTVSVPQAGTYFIHLVGYNTFSGVTLAASYSESNGNQLENGVAISGLSGAEDEVLQFTIDVPAGAQNLDISISGGSGDADLYVRFGAEPNLSVYDCRPYLSGNNETCTTSAPRTGTYFIDLVGYRAFSGVTLVASYTEPGGNTAISFANDTNYSIPDNNASGVSSPITSTRQGSSGQVTVHVEIIHTYIGDLIVDVIHPDGTVVNLHNRSGGSSNNINQIYTINYGNRDSSGVWYLRVRDRASVDTGYIDRWQIDFQ